LAAFVVVLAESIVLFLFSSKGLEGWLLAHGLPAIPLVPISSSQAVIGGIIGIGIVRKGKDIRYRVLGDIALGWLATPLLAGVITFFGLFVLQNVFNQQVYRKVVTAAAEQPIRPPKQIANPGERTAPKPNPASGSAQPEQKSSDPGGKQPDQK